MYLQPETVKEQAVAGAMAALPLPLLSHVLYPPITHEYSRTLGRSPACTNSRRAPCRTPCDETQTPFERALPPPGIQRFDRARILTNVRPHIGQLKLTTGPVAHHCMPANHNINNFEMKVNSFFHLIDII